MSPAKTPTTGVPGVSIQVERTFDILMPLGVDLLVLDRAPLERADG
jgi:hypothetical protein